MPQRDAHSHEDLPAVRPRKTDGFSLLETLIVSVLVAALATAVLQSLAFAFQAHLRTRESWSSTLRLWNRAVRTRSVAESDADFFRPLPAARPLRIALIAGSDPDRERTWEVLCAEK